MKIIDFVILYYLTIILNTFILKIESNLKKHLFKFYKVISLIIKNIIYSIKLLIFFDNAIVINNQPFNAFINILNILYTLNLLYIVY